MKGINFDEFPCGEDRYNLEDVLGCGAFAKVFLASDTQADGKKVAIKVQKLNDSTKKYVGQEYKILRDLSNHANLTDFYGIYRSESNIWFVMEFCEGGSIIDLVNGILNKNRRMAEEHIAYILKETVKALVYLHENKIIHRDVRASNVLLTKEGEVKLSDFGSSCTLLNTTDKTGTRLGSPCWMAPELVAAKIGDEYGNRVDVWSLGITAIELGDGEAPYQKMHPTRALFQIVRNPPPKLYRPSNWSENYNDFISECLEKNPEYRPYIIELIEHPFLEQVPDNYYHLTLELKALLENQDAVPNRPSEVAVNGSFLKKGINEELEPMLVEDLAALEYDSEDAILTELKERYKLGDVYSFIGDILLFLNPNTEKHIYGDAYHSKYHFKSRSDNAPHIYAIGDSAYQNALHHQVSQKIVLAGESGSGKTFNYFHLLEHLFFLGANSNINFERLRNTAELIHYFISASTPINKSSTRAVLKTTLTFNSTAKLSGAIFSVHQLEKWRISGVDMCQGNFGMLYYVYDGLKAANKLEQFHLNSEQDYRYLRISNESSTDVDGDVEANIARFKKIMKTLEDFEFTEDEINTVLSIIAAILVNGEIRFKESENGNAIIDNPENVEKVASLLQIDQQRYGWALTNYCFVQKGTAVKRRSTVDEARDARDVLANNLYCRLVDYVLSAINHKLSFGRKIFGEKFSIEIYDYFGFECFKRNHLSQLFVNSFNEQLQYHYLQRLFSWESMDISEEEIEYEPFPYFDNKPTLDQLLGKSEGVFSYIDEASKMNQSGKYVIDYIQSHENQYINVQGNTEFAVAHYTGKVTYDAKEMPDKNRDFLPPEIIETFRLSDNLTVRMLFSNKLDKTGNLIIAFEDDGQPSKGRYKFEINNPEKLSANQYSQIKKMRTCIATFKALSLDLLKELSVGSGSGSTHFVRCIRTDLKNRPQYFKDEIVRQQMRALAVVETAKGRQKGYPCRINFSEFLRRYQFLAFDFDENVEMTRDNCRLLLIRLKMEGWCIGKSKVFLKFYNEEYLARLYEVQVKKITKIQSILRRFLAKCRLAKTKQNDAPISAKQIRKESLSQEEAALIIQRAYREAITKHTFNRGYGVLDKDTCDFIRSFARKWKTNSLFHVLMQYRAIKFQDTFSFGQQVHLYNLNVYYTVKKIGDRVDLNGVHEGANFGSWLGDPKPTVLKIPFRLCDIDYYDTSGMCDLLTNPGLAGEDAWDTPYRWRKLSCHKDSLELAKKEEDLIFHPYSRDPEAPVKKLPEPGPAQIEKKSIKEKKNQDNKVVQYKFNTKTFDENKINSNTFPANKDFDYIKPPALTAKPKPDPIAELRNMGKQGGGVSEDDPPFNFKGMLRKTNFQRSSFKKEANNVVVNFNQKQLKNFDVNGDIEVKAKEAAFNGDVETQGKMVSLELLPGVFIKGIEVDL